MPLPLVWFRFDDAAGDRWTVFLTTHATTKALHRDKHGGPYVGKTLWKQRRIYVDANQTATDLHDTTLHELTHVAIRPLNLPSVIDEEIVSRVAEGLWPILADVPVAFPPVPECLRGRIKE